MPSILLKPHLKKKQHPNNFSRGSPWAALIFNSMFVVMVLYCVQFFLKWCFSKIPFSFPFPLLKLFSFYSLRSIRLEFSKCLISFNFPKYSMPYLFKPHLKTKLKQFFKGVAHEQHWSSIVCLLSWSSIVSSFFLKWFVFPKSFSPAFVIAFVSYLV